ncbi:MAG: hypothetical protein NUV77_03490 [Thermoguttaceae bacterium]|jgi:outer membrane murein-binding lipoprotein Lpp|nr:hypothetical protein [Thermoguttaceae bacterium]
MHGVSKGKLTVGFLAAFVFAAVALSGCRTDPAITALERENRDLEDEIYALQDLLDRTQDELDACRRAKSAAGEAPRAPADHRGPSAPRSEPTTIPTPERVPLPTPRGPEPGPSRGSASASRSPRPSGLDLPKIELPSEPLPQGQVPPTLRRPSATP